MTDALETIELTDDLWSRCLLPSALVLVGTQDPNGGVNFAPKHMVMPLGWGPWLGFVCSPTHATFTNAKREGAFTVSWIRPTQVLDATLSSAPRDEAGAKPALQAIPSFPAKVVQGGLVTGAALFAECELDRVVEDLGKNVLLIGRVVALHASPDVLRRSDQDDADLVAQHPLLVYLHPGRFAVVDDSHAFPFHVGFTT